MITEKTQIIKTFNPFSDSYEDVIAVFEIYFDSKGIVGEPNLIRAMTNAECDLMDWLSDKMIEAIEGGYQEDV